MNKKREIVVKIPSTAILGIPVHNVTMNQTIQLVQDFFNESSLHQIVTVNPEFIITAQNDPEFLEVLKNADLSIADGIGLLYAARWLGSPLNERVPGSELVYYLAESATREGWQLFLLGAGPGIAQKTANILKTRYPGLKIAGTYAGSPAIQENEKIVDIINKSEADLLFVAYGAPNQDKWIARNRELLKTVKVGMGVGGAFDFISGERKRAPDWVQKIHLEWFFRLIQEPWRWRRMLALPEFAVKVLFSPKG